MCYHNKVLENAEEEMKRTLTMLILSLAVVAVSSCAIEKPRLAITPDYIRTHTTTKGHYSHIWLGWTESGLSGGPEQNVRTILEAISAFEANHPELEITDWKLNARYTSYGYDGRVYGIWIDHRPKAVPVSPEKDQK